MKNKFNAIDLFSGCGGFSFGFQDSNFNVIIGVDNDEVALKTFKKNHTDSQTLLLDLHTDEAIDEIVNCADGKEIDVIIGGPPCQGFSLTGTRDENDKRNTLFNAMFKLARKVKPKALIIENVPGLLKLYNGRAKEEIYQLCDENGYSCSSKVLFAPDFGVPQIRKRVFFVALLKELGVFDFPKELLEKSDYIGCEAAIGDLPSLVSDLGADESSYQGQAITEYQRSMRNGSTTLYNHLGTRHTPHVVNVISQVPEGGNHKDLPEGVGDSRKFNEAWTRYHSKKPSKTIDTGHRNHFHYKYHRVPTVRENARLQSFPDDFIFIGNKTQQYKQVGNAVPPLLGKVLAHKLTEYLSK